MTGINAEFGCPQKERVEPIFYRRVEMNNNLRVAADIEKEIDWENKEAKVVLSELYDLTVERMQSELNWYEKLIPRMRWGSYALRAFSIVFLIFGVIAPLLGMMISPAGDAASQLRYSYAGYIGLALAGILFSIDKFFVVSKTWMRYTWPVVLGTS